MSIHSIPSRFLRSSLRLLPIALLVGAPLGAARAADPAVKEANGRVAANYDYTHLFSDDIFRLVPAPPTSTTTSELDVDSGGFTGFYTLPIAESFGARVFGGATFSKSHTDTYDEIRSEGVQLGGDIFWRDPAKGELGFGTFYQFSDFHSGSDLSPIEQGTVSGTEHTAGVRTYGELFLDDVLGFGPADLDLGASFSDSDIDDKGASSAERNYSAVGGVRFYTKDWFSFRVGGRYSRTNFGAGGFIETRTMEVDANVLLPMSPNITMGAGFSVGTSQESPPGFENYGRMYLGFALSATVSFPGAESLVELNRAYY